MENLMPLFAVAAVVWLSSVFFRIFSDNNEPKKERELQATAGKNISTLTVHPETVQVLQKDVEQLRSDVRELQNERSESGNKQSYDSPFRGHMVMCDSAVATSTSQNVTPSSVEDTKKKVPKRLPFEKEDESIETIDIKSNNKTNNVESREVSQVDITVKNEHHSNGLNEALFSSLQENNKDDQPTLLDGIKEDYDGEDSGRKGRIALNRYSAAKSNKNISGAEWKGNKPFVGTFLEEYLKRDSSKEIDNVKCLEKASPIVIDSGRSFTRAGFGGTEAPEVVFPSVLGKKQTFDGTECTYCVGKTALENRQRFCLTWPFKIPVRRWDDIAMVWKYIFETQLRAKPACCPVLLAEAPFTTREDREAAVQIMFQQLRVPALCVVNKASLALFANGLKTGLVVLSSHSNTFVVPVYQGQSLSHATFQCEVSGKDVEEFVSHLLLMERRDSLPNMPVLRFARRFKENKCYVALNYEREREKASSYSVLSGEPFEFLPERFIKIGKERFMGPEVMFQPSLRASYESGLHEVIYNSITACDAEIQTQLFANIVLAGSNTTFPGLAVRLQKEVAALAPPSVTVNVKAPPDRRQSVWEGGSRLSSLNTFQDHCVSREEYENDGFSSVYRRTVCPAFVSDK